VIELTLAIIMLAVPIVIWIVRTQGHRRRVDALKVRVHVNGIRGKSSVSRLISGVLREAGYTTIAKTTGSAAVVIDRDGVDHPIVRKGPATILEQLEIVKRWVDDSVDALVIECMAINPMYQRVCERQIVRSMIGVITNVREDHQDVMGYTLPDIARSLLNTCPQDGVLITAEQNPEVLDVMRRTVAANSSELITPSIDEITPDDMRGFSYIEFEDNVIIALEVARQLGIEREVAMRGMWSAEPDPGVLRVINTRIGDKLVTWSNMFAVNDRESTIAVLDRVNLFVSDDTTVIGILNNRPDRQQRAIQFADIAANDLTLDRIVTFGAYERVVTDRLKAQGYPARQIINLGDERDPSFELMLKEMVHDQPTGHVLLAGLVNIHTHQAEQLLDYFEECETTEMRLEDAS